MSVDRYYAFPNHLADIQDRVAYLRTRSGVLAQAADQLEAGQRTAITEIAELYASFAGCMALLAAQLPYKAEDRVRLVVAPACEGGWARAKHYLVVGALGTVKSVSLDYLMRDWCVYVEFDDESWIAPHDWPAYGKEPGHKKGDIIPCAAGQRHVYGLGPRYVEKVP